MSVGKSWKTEGGHKKGSDDRWEHRHVAKEKSRVARHRIDRLIAERYEDADEIDEEDAE